MPELTKKHINDFLTYIICEKGYSSCTFLAYRSDLEKFFSFSKETSLNINRDHVLDFLVYLRNKELSQSTINRNIAALKMFFKFLKNEKIISQSLLKHIEMGKKEFKIPLVLTIKEVNKLLDSPHFNGENGLRDKAILEVLYGCGVRVGELINMKIENIRDGFVKVNGKGDKERIVPIGKKALEAIDNYLKTCKRNPDEKRKGPVFLSKRSKLMNRTSIGILIKKYTGLAKIKKRVYPHLLRHTYATHMMENGADMRVIQELLGHENISSTDMYTHMSVQHIQKEFRRVEKEMKKNHKSYLRKKA